MIVYAVIIVTAFAGYLLKSLSVSGSLVAILVGAAIYAGFGTKGLILLGLFFASSSLWSKYKSMAKKALEDKLEKGSVRDWRQVVANGGTAAFFSIIYYFHQDVIWLIGFAVSLASANSDTWASEIGSLSKRNPVFIRTMKRTEKGTSGAISLLGTFAALLGSFLIALVSSLLFQLDYIAVIIIFLFGFIGNVIDTLFGAFYQQVYICRICGIETEKKVHCQCDTKRIKGFSLVDNDMVNFLSGLIAAVLAIGLTQFN
nr:DUF92 domain-containing protein [Neobacillus sp. Marseille-Q6967]